jgi:hypothetical protein
MAVEQQQIDNIYEVIKESPGITAKEVSSLTGYDFNVVQVAIDSLVESRSIVNEAGQFTAVNLTDQLIGLKQEEPNALTNSETNLDLID